MNSTDEAIHALRTGHERLAALVATFAEDELTQPSGAATWDIAHVLRHLGCGAEITHAIVRDSLKGKPKPDPHVDRTVRERWGTLPLAELCDAVIAANDTLTGLYESLDVAARADLRIDVGFLPMPVDVGGSARLRLSELALHSWDVQVRFDPRATLALDATRALLHRPPDLIGWIGKSEPLAGAQAAIGVTTSLPSSEFVLRLGSRISLDLDVEVDGLDDIDGTLALPAEAWLRLVAGRLADRHTPEGVVTSGAADLDLLRRVFPGY